VTIIASDVKNSVASFHISFYTLLVGTGTSTPPCYFSTSHSALSTQTCQTGKHSNCLFEWTGNGWYNLPSIL